MLRTAVGSRRRVRQQRFRCANTAEPPGPLSSASAEFDRVATLQIAARALRLRLLAVEPTLLKRAGRGGGWRRRALKIARRAAAGSGTLRRLKSPAGAAT